MKARGQLRRSVSAKRLRPMSMASMSMRSMRLSSMRPRASMVRRRLVLSWRKGRIGTVSTPYRGVLTRQIFVHWQIGWHVAHEHAHTTTLSRRMRWHVHDTRRPVGVQAHGVVEAKARRHQVAPQAHRITRLEPATPTVHEVLSRRSATPPDFEPIRMPRRIASTRVAPPRMQPSRLARIPLAVMLRSAQVRPALPMKPQGQAHAAPASQAAGLRPRALPALAWGEPASPGGIAHASLPDVGGFPGSTPHAAVPVPTPVFTSADVAAIVQRQSRAAPLVPAQLDRAVTDRIADEVLRRVEKTLRIERERRGR